MNNLDEVMTKLEHISGAELMRLLVVRRNEIQMEAKADTIINALLKRIDNNIKRNEERCNG